MDERTENDALIEIATRAAKPGEAAGIDGLLISASPLAVTNLEGMLYAPRRMRGDCTVDDLASLKEEALRFADAPVVYLVDNQPEPPKVIAVLNAADAHDPAWQDHRVVLPFRHSDAWRAWLSVNDKPLSQAAFAEHVEEWLHTCFDPAGAAMLELVTNLEATKDVSFKSGVRLQDGSVKFENTENLRTSVVIPPRITIKVALYDGRPPMMIEGLLRYRIESGKLTFRVKFLLLSNVIEQASLAIAADVGGAMGAQVIRGKPLLMRAG